MTKGQYVREKYGVIFLDVLLEAMDRKLVLHFTILRQKAMFLLYGVLMSALHNSFVYSKRRTAFWNASERQRNAIYALRHITTPLLSVGGGGCALCKGGSVGWHRPSLFTPRIIISTRWWWCVKYLVPGVLLRGK